MHPHLSFPWPEGPRWGVYAHTASSDLYSVVAVQQDFVRVQTGLNLAAQFAILKRVVQVEWRHPTVFKHVQHIRQLSPFRPVAAWVMPDAHLESFEWPCSSKWGPQDIEAECRLEASSRMQIEALDVALDYEVHRSPEGRLWAKVWMGRQTQVDAQVAQVHALGLQLQLVTSYSHIDELALFFKCGVQAQQHLHQRINSQAAACLQQGEPAC